MNKCQTCGAVLKGRPDKKFCDGICRSRFNNKLNRDVTSEIRNINNVLRRNRRILEVYAGHKVKKEKLSQAGFDFDHHTRTFKTEKGMTYRLCYDLAYLPTGDVCKVVRWDQNWRLHL